jgi:hypothetical protein
MTSQSSLTNIKQNCLSSETKAYLFSEEVFIEYERLAKEFGLPFEQTMTFFSTQLYELLNKDETLQQANEKFQMEFGLSPARSARLLTMLFSRVLHPIASEIPWFIQKISAWKQASVSLKDPMTQTEFIQSFLLSFVEQLETHIARRLESILSQYVNERRSKEETVNFLQRPFKLGGLEIDEKEARDLIDSFNEEQEGVEFTSVMASASQNISDGRSPAQPDEAIPAEIASSSSQSGIPRNDTSPVILNKPPSSVILSEPKASEGSKHVSVFLEDEIAEVKKIAEEKKAIIEQPQAVSVEQMVEKICSNPQFQFSNSAIQKRCIEIVTAHVRGVRDGFQTRALIERSVDAGGLGVSGRLLSEMVEQIERVVDAAQEERMKEVRKKKQEARSRKQEIGSKKQELIEKEERVMAKRFVQATGNVPNERVAPVAPPLSRASAAVSAHVQLQQQEARIDIQKVRTAVAQTVKQSPASIPTQRPRVQDVQFVHRLAGPIEELERMSLTEFRRLSSSPIQAIEHMKDMINLLDDQGYHERVAGVQALRRSPLLQVYSSITSQALLSGVAIDAVLSNQKGKNTMTKIEYDALMKLNADLRF